MAAAVEEQEDLARVPGGLLINFGTVEDLDGMLAAGFHANQNRKPVVFDPVGVGATKHRRACAASKCCAKLAITMSTLLKTLVFIELLDKWQVTVIKGNAAEIGALVNSDEVRLRSGAVAPSEHLLNGRLSRSRHKVSTVWEQDSKTRQPLFACLRAKNV